MAGLLRDGGRAGGRRPDADAAEVLGANTLADLVALDATMRAATASRLMAAGVTIFRPDTCVIDAEVEVAAGHDHRAVCAVAGPHARSAQNATSDPIR